MPDSPGRRVLVTGGTGFIGRCLIGHLLEADWEVHCLVRAASGPLASGVHRHVDDGSRHSMDRAAELADPMVCFHLAARVLASHKADDVSDLVSANIAFTTRLAEALSSRPGTLILNAGTYAQHVDGALFRAATLYAATKQAAEDVLRYYADAGLLRIVNLKLPTVYGYGDGVTKLSTLLLEAAASGEAVDASGGQQVLDLVYVDDVAQAFLTAADEFAESPSALFESYAVTSGKPLSLRVLATEVENVTRQTVDARWGVLPYRRHEQFEPWYTGQPLPGWTPRVTLRDGLRLIWQAMAARQHGNEDGQGTL